ncbi:hypothetical protein [Larkinella punicea]|uniref:Uncharacterized protein n=1 Tax=Larkinella punicea TaxID=2315727 RepID=A0A368JLE7_9BACT|nr:hypothetical protein [Larkinella punicea]RCR68479.1 hypothetical protein DUE52_17215 [Larkinella punicea]
MPERLIRRWRYAYGNTPEGRAQMKALMENGGTDKGGGTINEQGVRGPALAGADTYLEFSFAESLGNLEPSSSTGNIRYRMSGI